MSYQEDSLEVLKSKLIELRFKYQNIDEYNLEIFKLVSQFYLFLNDSSLKNEIINKVLNMCYLNNQKIYEIINFILDKNILIIQDCIIYNRWIIIGNKVQRIEYILIKKDNAYQIEKKDVFNSVNYLELKD